MEIMDELAEERKNDPRFAHPSKDQETRFNCLFKVEFSKYYNHLTGFNLFLFSYDLGLPTGYPEMIFELNSRFDSGASDLLESIMIFPHIVPRRMHGDIIE
jgi:hypothetical protein